MHEVKFTITLGISGFASYSNAITQAVSVMGYIKGLLNQVGIDCSLSLNKD